jgi:hypothetical protein
VNATAFCVLVMAKAPHPGRAKTRLSPPLSLDQAAELAAVALLDTVSAAVAAADGNPRRVVVALDGQIQGAVRGHDLQRALRDCRVIPQRGVSFAQRLVAAHADAAAEHPAVVQIGMDTPQVTPGQIRGAARALHGSRSPAVLGPAVDGGWWLLALQDPRLATGLAEVPMSTPSTFDCTRRVLTGRGADVRLVQTLQDVDSWPDALAVAEQCASSRFAASVREVAR